MDHTLASTEPEALVITAAEAVHGQRADFSSRRLDLAARACALPHQEING